MVTVHHESMDEPARLKVPKKLARAYVDTASVETAVAMIGEYGKHEVLNKGHPSCAHGFIHWLSNSFDGQAWWCDVPGCGRHERLGYTPGQTMGFPRGALIRFPHPTKSGDRAYSSQADDYGKAHELPPDERILLVDDAEDLGMEQMNWKAPEPAQKEQFGLMRRRSLLFNMQGELVEWPSLPNRKRPVTS